MSKASAARPHTYLGARLLFVKALALIYLAAFVSLAVQVQGLLGADGVLPAAAYLSAAKAQLGARAYWLLPSVFWVSAGDLALKAACWSGAAVSLVLLLGFFPGPCLLALWALYLSLLSAGQDFLGFQWDILLVETGFLAVFVAPWRARPGLDASCPPEPAFLWMVRWLLFRLMFESGCVKLLSHDPTWRSLTALTYHYQTQPLPTWLGWFAQQLGLGVQKASCAAMFFIELVVPWLALLPWRAPRLFAFASFVLLQALIALTGNYCFFNALTVALALPLLDDGVLRVKARPAALAPAKKRWRAWAAVPVGALAFCLGGLQLLGLLSGTSPRALTSLEPLHLVNGYGLFAMMTTERDEIVIEGSDDGKTWREYAFRWKPGDVDRRPRFVAPHQPRLDWQMWFAALGPVQQSPWFVNLLVRLLQGSPPVLALLGPSPFPEHPPRFIRALLYEYRFTSTEERRATGAWWKRQLKGPYCPVVSLRPPVPGTQIR